MEHFEILPTASRKFRNYDPNVKKVAVNLEEDSRPAILIEFDQRLDLESIIAEICSRWDLQAPSSYVLKFNNATKTYITERNRKDVKNGNFLLLALSAEKKAIDLKLALGGSRGEDKTLAVSDLLELAGDVCVAEEFIAMDGLQLLVEVLTTGYYIGESCVFVDILQSFVRLMKHGLAVWDILEGQFIKMKNEIQSKSMRNIIMMSVMKEGKVLTGMDRELYVLQTLLLNVHKDRMAIQPDMQDQMIIVRGIEELRTTVFKVDVDQDGDNEQQPIDPFRDYKRLGFKNIKSPVEDFLTVPPGVLALDVMLYFARNHGQNYVKVVLENSTRAEEQVCPFVQASIMLTKTLCDVLNIGEPPTDDGQTFYSMFFTHKNPFEEFFCICIQLLNKTWREMKATSQDLRKVLEVVKEQITRTLDSQPTSFESFRSKINNLSYMEINKIWLSDRMKKEEQGANVKPIIQLREKLKPEILELIKQQRINHLMSGTRFCKYAASGKVKDARFWYWRLSPNKKTLLYGDCGEQDTPAIEKLANKLPVSNIQTLHVGKDCPHIAAKEKGRTKVLNSHLAFSFCLEGGTPVCFMAESEREFDMWTDGIKSLLGKDMTSGQVKKDLDILLPMEIKMRILETEGVPIPTETPIVPPPPTHYNLNYPL